MAPSSRLQGANGLPNLLTRARTAWFRRPGEPEPTARPCPLPSSPGGGTVRSRLPEES